jgi:hypothetical protein
MRKIISVLGFLIFTLSITLLVSGIVSKTHRQQAIKQRISKLPCFSFATLENGSFNSSQITVGPVLVVRFHPECEHCRYEIEEIFNSSIPLSGARVILVSDADAGSIKKMLLPYVLTDYPSVTILADTSCSFGEIFGIDIVPSSYIYDKDLELVKVLYGEVKTETILKYLPGNEQAE